MRGREEGEETGRGRRGEERESEGEMGRGEGKERGSEYLHLILNIFQSLA